MVISVPRFALHPFVVDIEMTNN